MFQHRHKQEYFWIITTHAQGLKGDKGVNEIYMRGSNIRFNIKMLDHIRGYTRTLLYIPTQKINKIWDNTRQGEANDIRWLVLFHVQIHLLMPETSEPPTIKLWCPYEQPIKWCLTTFKILNQLQDPSWATTSNQYLIVLQILKTKPVINVQC